MAKKKPVEDQTEQDAAPDESVVWASNLRELGEVDPRDLIAHPLNPKIHTELQREAIGAALGRIGWVLPIIVNRTTGRIIDGHGRVEEAIAAGVDRVPVLYVEVDEETERRALVTLDPVGQIAGYDGTKLRTLMTAMEPTGDALDQMLAGLAQRFPAAFAPTLTPSASSWAPKQTYEDGQKELAAKFEAPPINKQQVICPDCGETFWA